MGSTCCSSRSAIAASIRAIFFFSPWTRLRSSVIAASRRCVCRCCNAIANRGYSGASSERLPSTSSWNTSRPAADSRYVVRSGRLPSRDVSTTSISPSFSSFSTAW